MPRHGLNMIFAVRALREIRTTRADRAAALVFPVTDTVCCGIAQYLVIGTDVAIVVFVINVFMLCKETIFCFRPAISA